MSFSQIKDSTPAPKTPPLFQRNAPQIQMGDAQSSRKEIEKLRELLQQSENERIKVIKELEEAKKEKRVFFSQQHVENLAKVIHESHENSSVGPVIEWLNNPKNESSEQFWTKDIKLDFSSVEKTQKAYNDSFNQAKKDLESFNTYFNAWNTNILDLTLTNKIREWLIDANHFPSKIKQLFEQLENFKKKLEPLLQTNFLIFDANSIPGLKQQYLSLKASFEKIDANIQSLANDPEYPILLKRIHGIVHHSEKIPSQFLAIRRTNSLENFRLDELDSSEVNGWVSEHYKQIEKHEENLYSQLLDSTSKNWFLLITLTVEIKSTLQCLGETIELIMPIRNLQAETSKNHSFAKTNIDASRDTSTKTERPNLEDLRSNLGNLEKAFRQCLKNKNAITNEFAGATKRLDETNSSLINRLTVQATLLNLFVIDPTEVNEKVAALQKIIKEEQVLVSSHLNAAWKEISEVLPATAKRLDKIDYAVTSYGGAIPSNGYFKLAYAWYSGRFYKMLNETNLEAPSSLVFNSSSPLTSEDDMDTIPVKTLILDEEIPEHAEKWGFEKKVF